MENESVKLTVSRWDGGVLYEVDLQTLDKTFPVGSILIESGRLLMRPIPNYGGLVMPEYPVVVLPGQSLTFKIE